jgi:hypothetical protein
MPAPVMARCIRFANSIIGLRPPILSRRHGTDIEWMSGRSMMPKVIR